LPRKNPIIALIGSGECAVALKGAPKSARSLAIVKDVDPGNSIGLDHVRRTTASKSLGQINAFMPDVPCAWSIVLPLSRMVISDIYQQKVSLRRRALEAVSQRGGFEHRIVTISFNVPQPNRGSILP
jgi:hypothetical protein